jgi:hypothetical protein
MKRRITIKRGIFAKHAAQHYFGLYRRRRKKSASLVVALRPRGFPIQHTP